MPLIKRRRVLLPKRVTADCACPSPPLSHPPFARSFFLRDGVKEPLGIGDVLLEEGSVVKGFIGEAYAVAAAPDITHHGGWRAYLAASQK